MVGNEYVRLFANLCVLVCAVIGLVVIFGWVF